MTKAERNDPGILNASRRKRISAGCGQPVSKINTLIKRYDDAKKMLKQFNKPGALKKNRFLKGLFQIKIIYYMEEIKNGKNQT